MTGRAGTEEDLRKQGAKRPPKGEKPADTAEHDTTANRPLDSEDPATTNGEGSRLERWAKTVDSLRAIIIGAAAILFALVIGSFIVGELSRDAILIERIEVPEMLAQRGFNAEVMGRELLEQVLLIREGARTAKEKEQLAPGWTETDIEVPGTGMSLHSLIRFLKRYETRIGGAVTVAEDGALRLRLRTSGRRVGLSDVESEAEAELDDLLHLGAREVMRATDPFVLAAHLYFEERDRPAACKVVRHCLVNETDKDDAWAYNLWGLILNDYGYEEEAIHRFEQAIALDADFAQPHNNWGLVLLGRDELDDAERKLRQAVQLDAEFPLAHINLAGLLARRGDKDEPGQVHLEPAMKELDRALELDPGSPDAWLTRGLILLSYGSSDDLPEAIDSFRRALELAPRYASAYYGWGLLYEKQMNTEAASEMFRRTIAQDPDFGTAYYDLGAISLDQEDWTGALERLQVAWELDRRLDFLETEFLADLREGLGLGDAPPRSLYLDQFGCPSREPEAAFLD